MVVTPLLKKQGLELVFKNFRPISNLSLVSKLTERVAADQIQSYLNEHDLFPLLQSAYRRHHSTKTALLKVKNDILMNMENQKVTLLVLLDLSAEFDTVDPRMLSSLILEFQALHLSGLNRTFLTEPSASI